MLFRNFLGAFLGGVVGILGAAWFFPDYVYPMGGAFGIVGVLSGFYYKKIPGIIKREFTKRCQAFMRYRYEAHLREIERSRIYEIEALQRSQARRERWQQLMKALSDIWAAISNAAVIVSNRINNITPLERVKIIRATAYAAFLVLHFVWVSYAWTPLMDSGSLRIGSPATASGLVFYALAMATMYLTAGTFEKESSKTIDFISPDDLNGDSLHLFGRYLKILFHNEARVLMFGIGGFFYYVVSGLLAVSFVALPALALWSIAYGFYEVSRRKAHIPCLVITTATVLTVAVYARSYMEGIGLLLIAVTTGVAAGAMTEAVRRATMSSASQSFQSWVTELPVKQYLRTAKERYMAGGTRVNDFVRSLAPRLIKMPVGNVVAGL